MRVARGDEYVSSDVNRYRLCTGSARRKLRVASGIGPQDETRGLSRDDIHPIRADRPWWLARPARRVAEEAARPARAHGNERPGFEGHPPHPFRRPLRSAQAVLARVAPRV